MSEFYTSVKVIGNNICYRGIRDGKRVKYKVEYSPSIFVNSKKPTEYKGLYGEYLERIQPGSIRETRDFIKKYDDVQGFNIHGNTNFDCQYISDNFKGEIKWDKELMNIYSIDIETTTEYGFPNIETANEQVLLISLMDNITKKITTFGFNDYVNPDIEYIKCDDEYSMLKVFLDFWTLHTPDIITGWNVNLFDIPYLVRRIDKVLGDDYVRKLSPWGFVNERTVKGMRGKESIAYVISGISVLDYLDLYKKFTYSNQESYKLDHIAEVELGEKKLDHSEYDTFKEFYTQNFKKFTDYNIIDVLLIDKLEDKMRLIELCLTMAYDAKINPDDVYSQVRMWDSIIFNHLMDRNIIIPKKNSANIKTESFEGAFVKDPITGFHKWVASFDLDSLYPHLIMQYNISPETLVENYRVDGANVENFLMGKIDTTKLIDMNYTSTANGVCYRKDRRGFLPELMQKMYDNRKKFKKEMLGVEQEYEKTKDKSLLKEISRLNNLQMAMKIALNSAYGAIGNSYFRYFDIRIAEGITTSGQLSIRWMANKLNAYMNKNLKTVNKDYVIAIDTDSIYLSLEELVEKLCEGKSDDQKIKYMDKICENIFKKFIDDGYSELSSYMNAYEQKMRMKREVLADKGIWIAKKRYILNVHNSEGVQYAEPKLKVMGLEMIKSSTPQFVRDKMKETVKIIISGDEDTVHSFIADMKEEFMTLDPSLVSFPRSMNGITKYKDSTTLYKKSTPIHVKGALIYNNILKEKKLDNRYPLIVDGDKIKFANLKQPNPTKDSVISFHSELPKEFDLHQYIDYNTLFELAYLNPMKVILESVGWTHEKTNSIEDFF